MFLFLVIFGNIACAVSVSLNCTNDFEEFMACCFDAENCTRHHVTLRGKYDNRSCVAQASSSGRCCCVMTIIPVLGETHQASVLRDGEQLLTTKTIDINDSIKPRAPTIVSVNESNGNFQVFWKNSGRQSLKNTLKAMVLYREGDNLWESEPFTPSIINQQYVYEIRSQDLKSSTRYLVSVRSVSEWSSHYSDRSQELPFTTPASASVHLVSVVVTASLSAVLFIALTYCSYVEIKSRWWDSVGNFKNSKLLLLTTQAQQLLKPEAPVILNLSVEPRDRTPVWSMNSKEEGLQSPQGTSTSTSASTSGSSLSYPNRSVDILARVQEALSKDLRNFNIKPQNEVLCSTHDGSYGVTTREITSGPVHLENPSYCPQTDSLAGTGSEGLLLITNEDVTSTEQCGDDKGVPTSGPSPVNSPPPPSLQHLLSTTNLDLLIPVEQGYKAFQPLVDEASVPLVGAKLEVKHPGMSAEHWNSLDVQRQSLSPASPLITISEYQCVQT